MLNSNLLNAHTQAFFSSIFLVVLLPTQCKYSNTSLTVYIIEVLKSERKQSSFLCVHLCANEDRDNVDERKKKCALKFYGTDAET